MKRHPLKIKQLGEIEMNYSKGLHLPDEFCRALVEHKIAGGKLYIGSDDYWFLDREETEGWATADKVRYGLARCYPSQSEFYRTEFAPASRPGRGVFPITFLLADDSCADFANVDQDAAQRFLMEGGS